MATTIKYRVEVIDEKVWCYVTPSCGDPADAPIHQILRWVLEQINFGNWRVTEDSSGRATSLTVGLAASAAADELSVNELADKVKTRLRSVNYAGIFARAREEGISPAGSDLAERVRMTATDAAYGNTETHYAFELLDLLEHIRASTFVFDSPPIHGKVAPEVVGLLREATRAYLLGLERSCVCICRALLEEALRGRVKQTELLNERSTSKRGELECFINVCERTGALDPRLAKQAHAIRKAGNLALHAKRPSGRSKEDAWAVLLDTRTIVEALYS
jgi:hypothetical protein